MMGARGKSVAVIGRAHSIIGSGSGPAIDACDFVVRVNWLVPIVGDPADVGTRTDMVYHAVNARTAKVAARAAGVPSQSVDKRLRRKLRSGRFRPTTGIVAIYAALRSGATEVHAFGFDLYRSGYVDPDRPRGPVDPNARWFHSEDLDGRLLRALLADPRFHADAVLADALVGKCA